MVSVVLFMARVLLVALLRLRIIRRSIVLMFGRLIILILWLLLLRFVVRRVLIVVLPILVIR